MSDAPTPPEPTRAAPLPGTPGHPSDLSTRFAVGIFLIAVAIGSILLGGWWFRVLVTIGAAIMVSEWNLMHRAPWLWTWISVTLMALLLLGGFQYFFSAGLFDVLEFDDGTQAPGMDEGTFVPMLYLFGAAIAAGLLLALVSRRGSIGWGFVYIALPSLALLGLAWIPAIDADGQQLARDSGIVFWVMVVTWSTDIGAYFAGRAIGGPKLAPRISPKKTWAGLVGGVIAAAILGWVAARYLGFGAPLDDGSGDDASDALYAAFFWLGGPMAIVAQLGDLYESSVKRRLQVKDSGSILPGHGGVLDRCDGLLAVSFATFLFVMVRLQIG